MIQYPYHRILKINQYNTSSSVFFTEMKNKKWKSSWKWWMKWIKRTNRNFINHLLFPDCRWTLYSGNDIGLPTDVMKIYTIGASAVILSPIKHTDLGWRYSLWNVSLFKKIHYSKADFYKVTVSTWFHMHSLFSTYYIRNKIEIFDNILLTSLKCFVLEHIRNA